MCVLSISAMALTDCPECGQQISDKAKFCPGCGYTPTEAGIEVSVGSDAKRLLKAVALLAAIAFAAIVFYSIADGVINDSPNFWGDNATDRQLDANSN